MPGSIIDTISPQDRKALEHDLLDVDGWVRDAVRGRENKCRKMGRESDVIPWVMAALAEKIKSCKARLEAAGGLNAPGYRNRAEREAAQKMEQM